MRACLDAAGLCTAGCDLLRRRVHQKNLDLLDPCTQSVCTPKETTRVRVATTLTRQSRANPVRLGTRNGTKPTRRK